MSEEFGNESPVLDQDPAPQSHVAQTPRKRKGGRSKEKNLTRGIPQVVIDKFNLKTPEHETDQQRKRRMQVARRYWAMRWYKFKYVPKEKWAMQFAFNPPYQYCMQCVKKYNEENRHLYHPVPPKKPHSTSVRTPDDYPEEQKRLAILAEKLRKKKEKEAAKKRASKEEPESSPPAKK